MRRRQPNPVPPWLEALMIREERALAKKAKKASGLLSALLSQNGKQSGAGGDLVPRACLHKKLGDPLFTEKRTVVSTHSGALARGGKKNESHLLVERTESHSPESPENIGRASNLEAVND